MTEAFEEDLAQAAREGLEREGAIIWQAERKAVQKTDMRWPKPELVCQTTSVVWQTTGVVEASDMVAGRATGIGGRTTLGVKETATVEA